MWQRTGRLRRKIMIFYRNKRATVSGLLSTGYCQRATVNGLLSAGYCQRLNELFVKFYDSQTLVNECLHK